MRRAGIRGTPGAAVSLATVTALSCGLLLACAAEPGEPAPDVEDRAAAEALWARLQAIGYRDFPRPPGYEERQPAEGPHGVAIDLFVNDVVDEALGAEPGSLAAWPERSLIVKEAFDAAGELELVAVLEKQDGSFVFAEFDAGGAPLFHGTPALCLGCHAEGSDQVLAFELP